MTNPLALIQQNDTTLAQLELWQIPDDTAQQDWQAWHTNLLRMQQVVKLLLPKSETFGRAKFGDDVWAETEAEFQLDFGLPLPEPTTPKGQTERDFDFLANNINRWISASVKQYGELETWDNARLTYAIDVLEPVEKHIVRIRELLEAAR